MLEGLRFGGNRGIFGADMLPRFFDAQKVFLGACALLLCGQCARGVIFYETGDVTHNREVAPGGAWAGSGWEFQGDYRSWMGTMISPRHFITAKHFGAGGTTFIHRDHFSGGSSVTYHINPNFNGVGYLNVGGTDLRIFEVYGEFASYAPLYTKSNEAGKQLVVFGRGVERGAAEEVASVTRGWRWGTNSKRARWGVNDVDYIADGGASLGELLIFDFDPVMGQEECQLGNGDSGGGLFIKDGSTWKLAGINYGVDAFYDTNDTCGDSSHFYAAMFDASDFYIGKDCDWELTSFAYDTLVSRAYVTRISASAGAIQTIIQPAIDDAALSNVARFEAWIAGFEVVEDQPEDNPDNDEWNNLAEYFGQGDPDASGDVPPFEVNEGVGVVQFVVRENLDAAVLGLSWVISESTTLGPGSFAPTAGLSEISNVLDLAQGVRVLTYEIPMPVGDATFYRLEVSLAP